MAHDELTRAAGEALTAARMKLGALTLTVELPATQPEIWRWITAPELLQQWSPVVPDRALTSLGAARSRVYLWTGISIVLWGIAFGVFGSLFLGAIS